MADSRLFTDAEWINELKIPGLVVVDLFAKFCGPCEPIQSSIFKRLKTEYGDQVHFVQAQTDGIEAFKNWRNKSCPTFTFWVNRLLVKTVLGANGPFIERTIKEQVEMNKSNIERQPMKPEISIPNVFNEDGNWIMAEEPAASENLPPTSDAEEATLAIIKPDAMIPHLIEEIKSLIHHNKFHVLKKKNAG